MGELAAWKPYIIALAFLLVTVLVCFDEEPTDD